MGFFVKVGSSANIWEVYVQFGQTFHKAGLILGFHIFPAFMQSDSIHTPLSVGVKARRPGKAGPVWPSPRDNSVLASLPDEDITRLHALMTRVLLRRDQVLHEVGERVENAYFLCEGLVSLTLTCQQGVDFELGLVGREGVVGEREVLADGVAVVRSQVQIAGSAYVLPMDVLKAEFRRGGPLQDAILRQIHARLIETSQVALCNHLHGMEEKLCRWLLTIYDRACTADLPLTQEFIARMLATRRSGVTVAAGTLRKSGLIDYSRGHIRILDAQGLEEAACECYRIIKSSQEPSRVASLLAEAREETAVPLASQFDGKPDLDGYQPPLDDE